MATGSIVQTHKHAKSTRNARVNERTPLGVVIAVQLFFISSLLLIYAPWRHSNRLQALGSKLSASDVLKAQMRINAIEQR
jgi:uncharacterized membrane protein